MGLLNRLKKSQSDKESYDANLQQALTLSKAGKHTEAYPIFEDLYQKDNNATNTFNLFQCAVYCDKTEVEGELYEKLKCYSPDVKKEPMELSGCFVRYWYACILCEVGRGCEAVAIVDYLIDVISHYKITDPTFLYVRGIPSAQMVYDLIRKTFADDQKQCKAYKKKLVSLLDRNTKLYDFKEKGQ